MNLLHWHRVFNDCKDLDGIHGRWHPAAHEHHLSPGYQTPEYRDAILSFIATSPLPSTLKLGALLTCVSGFDFDLRLALGVLDNVDDDTAAEWPTAFADAAALLGPCPVFAVRDPARANFALGRLASLRDALHGNRESHEQWSVTFWNAYLELACRWADNDALALALQRGAQPAQVMPQALEVLAQGVHSPAMDAPYYTEGRSNADYLAVIDRLRDTGLDLGQQSGTMLPAAALVDNTEMLEQLVARGADLSVAGRHALAAAASTAAHDAVQWLIAHGVNSADDLGAALVEAVGTLDETMTEFLLDAGADIHAADEQPLCTACAARPFELYNGETEFIRQRVDMITLLARRGAGLEHPRFVASLQRADQGHRVLSEVLDHPDLAPQHRRALAAAGASAFGGRFA